MILIDSKVGSKELLDIAPLSSIGVETTLKFGDLCFAGNGKTKDLTIGVELKNLSDFFQSFVKGRLIGHQVVGMREMYDVSYVCVFGIYRCNEEGNLETFSHYQNNWVPFGWRSKPTPYSLFEGAMFDLESLGVRVKYISSDSLTDVVYWICVLYNYWQKSYEERTSRVSVFNRSAEVQERPDESNDQDEENIFCSPLQNQLTKAQRFTADVAKDFPGIGGMKMAIRVAKHFKSVYDMVNAREEEWCNIDGIGKGKSRKIKQYITGEFWQRTITKGNDK